MTLAPITVPCPQCGSTGDVVYSCNPGCCFNHVCGRCFTTFELATTRVGEASGDFGPLPTEPDPAGPSAPCTRCGETKLFAIVDGERPTGQLLCVSCKALLTLDFTEVAPG